MNNNNNIKFNNIRDAIENENKNKNINKSMGYIRYNIPKKTNLIFTFNKNKDKKNNKSKFSEINKNPINNNNLNNNNYPLDKNKDKDQ